MNNCEEIDPGTPGEPIAPSRPRSRSRWNAPIVGLVGILVAFISVGSLFAMQQPPFIGADEKAHLGYAHVVADGSLPTVETRAEIPSWADEWMSEVIYTHTDANRTVWVANHPPMFYVSVAPAIWLAEATERPDGGLLYLRLANVVFGAVGLIFTFALARELTQSDTLALLSAAGAAMVTQLHAALSLAMSDGMTFAAGAAVTYAAVRCLQRGTSTRNLAFLAAATVVATGARAVTMLVAFVAVGVVACFEYRTARSLGAPRVALRAGARVLLAGVVPAIVLFGWFYVRNMVLYGDIGASTYLLDRFEREPNGSVLAMLFDGQLWRSLWFRSMSPVTYRGPRPPLMLVVATLGVVGLAIAAVTRRTGSRASDGTPHPLSRRSLVLLASGIAVIVWYIAEHLSGGGYLHPRYLFPVVGSVMVLLVIGLDRLIPRVLPAVVVAGMWIWTLSQIPVDVDVSALSRPRDDERLAPLALRSLPGGDGWRFVAGSGVVVGCALAAIAFAVVVARIERRRVDGDERRLRPRQHIA